jgi:alkylation response protein AidB-like acyl-CoA dehydrogenase
MSESKDLIPGGAFLITKADPSSTFIPEEINEEDGMIRDMCNEFITNEVMPHLDKIDKQEDGIMVDLLNKAGEQGLLGTSIPEKFGGFGKDFNANAFLAEAIGRGGSFPVSMMAHTGIGTLPILYFGTDEQKEKYLPKLATGEWKAAYCLTEPGSGSDALAAKTKAVLDGDNYVLNGQKIWITNAGFADVFVVFAQVEGEPGGFTGFIVERTMAGIKTGEEEAKMGIKGSSTAQVFFEDCKVPKENVLGEVGSGHLIAFNILNIGRFKLCAATLGSAKHAISTSVQYANERVQFKVPISSFGAIKHKLAEQAIRTFACESALYRSSDLINAKRLALKEAGSSYGEALMGSAREYAVECAILKVYGSETLDFVVDEAVQVHGGYGFSEEYTVARMYRDSRINRIFEGTNEINRLLIVDMLVKAAMKGELDILGAAKEVQKELLEVPQMGGGSDEPFAAEAGAIANFKKAVLISAGAAAQKLMMQLQHEQEILMHVSNMIIDTFVAESMLLRTMKLAEKRDPKADIAKEMLSVFINDATDRIRVAGKNAAAGFAEGDELKMILLGIKRFTKYPAVNTKEARRKIADQLIEAGEYCF